MINCVFGECLPSKTSFVLLGLVGISIAFTMNAYLFTAWISQVGPARSADSCLSLIVYGGEAEEAQAGFEAWLLRCNEGDNPVPTQIEKLVAAPVVENLFTELTDRAIDWPQVVNEAQIAMEQAEPDSTEEGCWVDCDAEVNPGSQIPDMESLRRGLPEHIRSGLNWSESKQFFFLVSALSPPRPLAETSSAHDDESADCAEQCSNDSDTRNMEFREGQGPLPELVEMEAVALVQARNSVVAAWLWRRYAAETRLAMNRIRIGPWCGAASIEEIA